MLSMTSGSAIPNLKVVTFNIWAIHFLSKDVRLRIDHIIEALQKSDRDIVALQEVWCYNDFLRIKSQISAVFSYSHYFKSGFGGSGCCIFSKHPIENVLHYKFTLNGYPFGFNKLKHLDWFGGKLVGLCVINYYGVRINAYVAHLHANHSLESLVHPERMQVFDEYMPHRVSQLFELAQFFSQTSQSADLNIVMGDLNTCDYEAGYKMLMQHTDLLDAYKVCEKSALDKQSSTCHSKTNVYQMTNEVRRACPDGIRIDFVLFNAKKGLDATCTNCERCFDRIEKLGINYSDHEGVQAEFRLSRSTENGNSSVLSQKDSLKSLDSHMEVRELISNHVKTISAGQLALACVGFMSLVAMFTLNPDFNLHALFVKNIILTLLSAYCFMFAFFFKVVEKNHLNLILDALSVYIEAHRSRGVPSNVAKAEK